jgi:hypothetical protein
MRNPHLLSFFYFILFSPQTLVAAPPRPGLWGLKRMDVNGIGLSLTPPTPDSESRRADTVGDTVYINPSPLPPPNSLGGVCHDGVL